MTVNLHNLSNEQLISLVWEKENFTNELRMKFADCEKQLSRTVKKLIFYENQLKIVKKELTNLWSVLKNICVSRGYTQGRQGVSRKNIMSKFSLAQTVELSNLRFHFNEFVNLIGGEHLLRLLKENSNDGPLRESIYNNINVIVRHNAKNDSANDSLILSIKKDNDNIISTVTSSRRTRGEHVQDDHSVNDSEMLVGENETTSHDTCKRVCNANVGEYDDIVHRTAGTIDKTSYDKLPKEQCSHLEEIKSQSITRRRVLKCSTATIASGENKRRMKGKRNSHHSPGREHAELGDMVLCNQKPVNADARINNLFVEAEILASQKGNASMMTLYHCRTCNSNIVPSKVTQHIRLHPPSENEKPFVCPLCGRSYTKKGGLKRHMINHLNLKLPCRECDRVFTQWDSLERHVNHIHRGINNFECSVCCKAFSDRGNLNKHIRIHTGERPYSCMLCDKRFYSSASLSSHQRSHNRTKAFQCLECDKKFVTSKSLSMHQKRHAGDFALICDVCGRGFNVLSNYNVHYKTHADSPPWTCHICKRGFVHPATLRSHVLRHSQTRDYLCTQCGKAFFRKDHFEQHMKRHSNSKSYKCSYCGKTFIDSVRLKYHQAVHTGDKPYCCDICGKHFTIPSILKTHKKTHQKTNIISIREKLH